MLKIILCCFFSLSWAASLYAAPYIPSSPAQVLEKLPANSVTYSTEFRALRNVLNTDPNNMVVATQLATLYIERSRSEGDPRYLGYAQAALAPWWTLKAPPIDVLVLRATILQSTHHFDESLSDLNQVLKLDPNNGQAWITKATILQVQANYKEAYESCRPLYNLTAPLITLTCLTNIQHLNGQAQKSYAKLKAGYAESGEMNPSIDVWVLTLLAEMATRLDDIKAAEQYFKKAIKIGEPDSYLLGAYSDFLLDQQRPQEVIELLKTKTRIDALLLRYIEALKEVHSPETFQQIDMLKQRFDAATMRGDTVHQREQSRFELRLMQNPNKALQIAQLNWQTQKEPADARIFLESAIAAKDKAAMQTIIQWLASTHLEDVALTKIMTKYKSAS